MRRFLIGGLPLILVLVLAACGGDDKKDNGGSGGGGVSTPLPTTAATDVPTATTIPIITNPTLPPAATIDVQNPSGNTAGNAGQPSSQTSPIPTRGGGPTLPPTWTPSSGNNAAAITPSAIPATVIESTFERPAICNTFVPDYTQTPDQHLVNTDLTIYWFPVEAEGVTYKVDLYNRAGVVVFSTEVPETQITFTGDYFPSRGTYYWVVQANQNGVLMNCGPIDNEVFVSG